MYDYHIHPYHSADGQMSLREMALSAIDKGLLESVRRHILISIFPRRHA